MLLQCLVGAVVHLLCSSQCKGLPWLHCIIFLLAQLLLCGKKSPCLGGTSGSALWISDVLSLSFTQMIGVERKTYSQYCDGALLLLQSINQHSV